MSVEHRYVALLTLLTLLQCFGCGNSDTSERASAAEGYLGLQGPVDVGNTPCLFPQLSV